MAGGGPGRGRPLGPPWKQAGEAPPFNRETCSLLVPGSPADLKAMLLAASPPSFAKSAGRRSSSREALRRTASAWRAAGAQRRTQPCSSLPLWSWLRRRCWLLPSRRSSPRMHGLIAEIGTWPTMGISFASPSHAASHAATLAGGSTHTCTSSPSASASTATRS